MNIGDVFINNDYEYPVIIVGLDNRIYYTDYISFKHARFVADFKYFNTQYTFSEKLTDEYTIKSIIE